MWHFTANERRGLIIWVLCVVSISFTPYIIPETDDNELIMSIFRNHSIMPDSLLTLFSESDSLASNTSYDPNTIDATQLQEKGLSEFIAKRWVRFRSAKGGFETKNDILSIYGIDSTWVELEKDNWDWGKDQTSAGERHLADSVAKPSYPKLKEAATEPNPPSGKRLNINTAQASELKSIGFNQNVAHRLVAYRKKAGPFYTHRDLLNIFDIDTQFVEEILPVLFIDTARLPYLDVNYASKEEWESLPGIGPVYAERIMKFRDALGGFIDKGQLKEVYGLPEATWLRISPRVKLRANKIQKLKVNAADMEDFARHPYIDWSLAKRLYRYKEQHYPIKNLDGMHGLDEEKLEKLLPYFDFSLDRKSSKDVAKLSSNDSK